MNSLYFYTFSANKGREGSNQMKWLSKSLAKGPSLIFTHIYAGSSLKYGGHGSADYRWKKSWTGKYFALMNKYKKNVILEVGAHDHFEDLRYNVDKKGKPMRPLLISTGVSPDHSQLPGYSTF